MCVYIYIYIHIWHKTEKFHYLTIITRGNLHNYQKSHIGFNIYIYCRGYVTITLFTPPFQPISTESSYRL